MTIPKIFCLYDTEYTAWENSQIENWSRPGEKKELIQIAVFKIKNEENELIILRKLNIFIKPKINPILSDYITNLTGITNKKINDYGLNFDDGMNILYELCKHDGKLINLYSYGNDYEIIEENLKYNKYPLNSKFYKWSKYHLDLIPIFKKENIPTEKYTSGTLYKHFYSNLKADPHNAEWDITSLLLSLNKIIKK